MQRLKRFLSLMLSLILIVGVSINISETVQAEAEEDTGLVVDKTISLQSDGNYMLELSAYATGEDTTTPGKEAVPLDIVLVLDQSGSMADSMKVSGIEYAAWSGQNYRKAYDDKDNLYILVDGEYYKVTVTRTGKQGNRKYKATYTNASGDEITIGQNQDGDDSIPGSFYTLITSTTRLAALKNAVTTFVTSVENDAATNKVDHRIAMVGFASESGYGNNTEGLSISGTNSGSVGIKYGDLETTNYQNLFQDTTTDAGKTMLTNAINALASEGATRTDLGMDMALEVLQNNTKKSDTKRKQVVIMFTDGTPTTQYIFSETVAYS
ncbi:MAG: VWA domain-containing protein, partial [Lachnospiraceae bacterium]|nr:VWA domain-containing protein [Lachnospiraceae bacterium]